MAKFTFFFTSVYFSSTANNRESAPCLIQFQNAINRNLGGIVGEKKVIKVKCYAKPVNVLLPS